MISLKESIISSNKAGFLYSSKFNEVLLDKFFDAFGDMISSKSGRFEYKMNGYRTEIYFNWKEKRVSEIGTTRGYISKEEWERVTKPFEDRLDKFAKELKKLKVLDTCYQNNNARGNYSYVVRFKDIPTNWKESQFEIKFWDNATGYLLGVVVWGEDNPFEKLLSSK